MLIESDEERPAPWIVPERQLWHAVLVRAIDDVRGNDCLCPDAALDAHTWVNDPGNEERTFIWICETLDLDYEVIRAKINSFYEARHGRGNQA